MGGFGSGKRWKLDRRQLVEECVALDARDLQRRGILVAGVCNCGQTYIAGLEITFWYDAAEDLVFILRYQIDALKRRMDLALTIVDNPLGGKRIFFRCPRTGDAVERLYLAPGERYFASRRALNLAYVTQNDDHISRVVRRAQHIRRQLGAADRLHGPFPPRPRYMHQRTYQALRERGLALEEWVLRSAGARLGILLHRG